MLTQKTNPLSDIVPLHCCSLQEAAAEAPRCPLQAVAMAVPQVLGMALLSHPQLGAAAGRHQRLAMAAWAHPPQPGSAGLPASWAGAVAARRPQLQPVPVGEPPILCAAAWAHPLLALVGPHPSQAAVELPCPAQDMAAETPTPAATACPPAALAAAACPPPTTSAAGVAAWCLQRV